jgi:hypothetical protein
MAKEIEILSRLLERFRRKKPVHPSEPMRPMDEFVHKEEAAEVLKTRLQYGNYCNFTGPTKDTSDVVDEVVEALQEDFLILRVSLPEEKLGTQEILDAFLDLAPEEGGYGLDSSLSKMENFTRLFKGIIDKSNKPVIAILENIQNIKKDDCGDLLRAIRNLYNSRAREHDFGWDNITFLLTGYKHPINLTAGEPQTSYNIGESFSLWSNSSL